MSSPTGVHLAHRSWLRLLRLPWLVLVALATLPAWAQAELGHKTLGTIGIDAGSQPEPGIYVADRVVAYWSEIVVDREGQELPVGLELNALANGFGIAAVFKIPSIATYVTTSFAIPLAAVDINTTRPEASIDRFGLGDIFLQPLRLGWRSGQIDAVVGYALYVPTGRVSPGGTGGGVSRGHFTHEPSLGATLAFDAEKTWRLSALASYDINTKKIGIDITRGDTLQIQGGLAKSIVRGFDVGLAFYALWQTTDDRGDDVPAVLLGARDFAFGLGPEVAVALPSPRVRVGMRYEHDLAVRSRVLGQIFVLSVTYAMQ